MLPLWLGRAVDGVIEATKEIGGNVEEVAKVAVEGAIEAAGTIGNTAVRAVKDMLVGVVEGVKEVASAALPKARPVAKMSSPAVETTAPEITTGTKGKRGE